MTSLNINNRNKKIEELKNIVDLEERDEERTKYNNEYIENLDLSEEEKNNIHIYKSDIMTKDELEEFTNIKRKKEQSYVDWEELNKNIQKTNQRIEQKIEENKKNGVKTSTSVSIPMGKIWILAIVIIILAALLIPILLPSTETPEEKMEDKMEFLDNMTTPGTSENEWYNDEYLPNTPGTPEYDREHSK